MTDHSDATSAASAEPSGNPDRWRENNPAGLLLNTLERFQRTAGELGATPVYRVWAHAFGVDENDVQAIGVVITDVRQVFRMFEAAVAKHAKNPKWLLQDGPTIEKLLYLMNLETDWRNLHAATSDGILRTLAHAAHELSEKAPAVCLTSDEMRTLRDALEGAYVAIDALALDPQARLSLLRALDGMQSALARYRTIGLEAFWEEWYRVLRDVIAANERATAEGAEKAARWEPVRRAFALFGSTAKRAVTLADGVAKLEKAYEAVTKLIGDGSVNV